MLFRSKQADDADKIGRRLATARQALVAAERDLTERLPGLILTDDSATLAMLRARVADARDRVGLIELAHRQALQHERDRLAEVRLRARKAEDRAFAQHLSAINRAAENCQWIVGEYQAAWVQLVDTAERARRLLPADGYRTFPELFEGPLQGAVTRELARVGRRGELMGFGAGPSLPGSGEAALLVGTLPSSIPSLVEHIEQITRLYSDRFHGYLALPTRAPDRTEPSPVVPEEPEVEPVDPTVVEPTELAAGAVAISAPVSTIAGAEPEPVAPHPEGSAEAVGYEAALAEIQGRMRAPTELAEA